MLQSYDGQCAFCKDSDTIRAALHSVIMGKVGIIFANRTNGKAASLRRKSLKVPKIPIL